MNFLKLISTASFFTALYFTNVKGMDPDSSHFHRLPLEVFENILINMSPKSRQELRDTCQYCHQTITILYPPLYCNEFKINYCYPSHHWKMAVFDNNLVIFSPHNKSDSDEITETSVEVINSVTFARHEVILPGNFCDRVQLASYPNGFYLSQYYDRHIKRLTFAESRIDVVPCNIYSSNKVFSMATNDKELILSYNGHNKQSSGFHYWNLETETPKETYIPLYPAGIIKNDKDKFIAHMNQKNGGFYLIDPTIGGFVLKKIQYPGETQHVFTYNFSLDSQQDSMATYTYIDGIYYHFYITNISTENPTFKKISFLPAGKEYDGQGVYLKGRYLFALNCSRYQENTLFTIYDLKSNRIQFQKNLKACTTNDSEGEMINIDHMLFFHCYQYTTRIEFDAWGREYNQPYTDKDSHIIMAINIKNYLDEENQVSQ